MSKKIMFIILIITVFTRLSPNAYEPILLAETKPSMHPFLASNSKPESLPIKSSKQTQKEIYKWFRTVSEVIHLMEQKHFRKVDFSNFIQGALKSAVPSTDAHSAFFTRESYADALESTAGEFSGIGISIMSKQPEDESLVVIDVIQGGPSYESGLQAGDKIVEVSGEMLKGLNSDEVVSKLRGKVGTEVSIKIIRSKKPMEFKITRNVIKDQNSICYRFKDRGISYISLKMFTDMAARQTAELLKKANERVCKGIILDLRRNPGGVLDAAVDMVSLFVEKDSLVVSTKDKEKKNITSYYTKSNPILKSTTPIFILIDNFTASASEILAGCLKYYSEKSGTNRNLMVFLVGTETFGKGSVQEVIPISNGCALKMTTMLYYLPDDISIQARGIKPDFTIKPKTTPSDELKWINELYGKETSLKHHISIDEVEGKAYDPNKKKEEKDTNKEDTKKNWEKRHKEAIAHDIQIQASVNMINMLSIAKKNTPELVENRPKALAFLKENYLTDDEIELEQIK